MIFDKVKIHDKYSFEIKLDYKLERKKKISSYKINSYFFIPNSLDINRKTYSKEDFYNDIKTYIRLKTPVFLMRDLISGVSSPYSKLKQCCVNISKNKSKEQLDTFEYFLKMFCCISQSAIRDSVSHIAKNKLSSENAYLIENFLNEIQSISGNYRKLSEIINIPTIPPQIYKIFEFGDEYISNNIEIYLYEFLKVIRKKEIDDFPKRKKYVISIIQSEINYRKLNKYNSIPDLKSSNESLLYRRSVLKKYIGNKLFLHTNVKKDGNLTEQLFFSTAAGIAMIFATLIAFFSKIKFGDLTFPFFIILVISYMLKDRIKELSRIYLSLKFRKIFFDHKTKIYTDNKRVIGLSKESFDFVKESKINPEIIKMRDIDHLTEIENGWIKEKIILYRKQIRIISKRFLSDYHDYNFEGIIDISRLNIENFIKKMDDPIKRFYVVDNNEMHKSHGDRVYHINAVIEYTVAKETIYRRFRIVLSKNGIKRIDEISNK